MADDGSDDLRRVMVAEEWRSQFGSTVFRTKPAWDWFKRDHRQELVEAGALFLGCGRMQDMVHVDRIGRVVQSIRQAESLDRIRRAGSNAMGGAAFACDIPNAATSVAAGELKHGSDVQSLSNRTAGATV